MVTYSDKDCETIKQHVKTTGFCTVEGSPKVVRALARRCGLGNGLCSFEHINMGLLYRNLKTLTKEQCDKFDQVAEKLVDKDDLALSLKRRMMK